MNNSNILGRVVKDPNLTFTPGKGTAVCKFTVAVNRPFKKGESDFIPCVAFGKQGETISQYFQKGSQIAITGRIQTGSYDKDGHKVYTTDLVVEKFDFVDSNKGNGNQDYSGTPYGNDGITPVDSDSNLMPF